MGRNSNTKWTEADDEKLLQMLAAKKSRMIMSASLGRSPKAIAGRLGVLRHVMGQATREPKPPEIPYMQRD